MQGKVFALSKNASGFYYILTMKKIILLLVLFFGASFAQKNNAIGLWVGDFSGGWGVDYKRLMGSDNTLDIYIGDFRLGDHSAVGVAAGYYFLFNVIKADASMGRFPLHVGPNLGLGFWSGKEYSGIDVGVSVAGGITWFTPTTPVMDVSIELVSPSSGIWHQSNKNSDNNTSFELFRDNLGLRLLFHVYFF